ncbi:FMN-dependent monooxygenase [Mycolicibacterium sp. P9-64]|uniref:LLM class flavin-dependent oxidoreductase n=1 Tax=Mycolicibacterium sp. P9-64 TaxID=2024612 RepID=UPI0011EE7AF7|nr:LLM class flavin-dependent oxidoreductase [Mycolicibacterium sp. P9-64]KAA0085954.1 FMN-dependent monooxygenase [Mycolicibacterium sp. P9-64]
MTSATSPVPSGEGRGPKQILTNAFWMASPAQHWTGLWAHPDSTSENYNELGFWLDLARTAERGLIDAVFMADGIGVLDVYEGKPDAVMRAGGMFPANDPMMVIPAMAAVTENLGFGITGNTSYETPYLLARRFSTLDHLTRGRVSWNVVTGCFTSVPKTMGTEPVRHDQRYDFADEYMDLMYKLWEQSWEDGAVLRDKEGGVFVDPSRVHPVHHEGRYPCEGIYVCEPSPQRTPYLYSAGASARGVAFAGKHAEAVFFAAHDKAYGRQLVDGYRQAAVDAGRAADDIKIFNAITIIVAPTEAEARDIEAECRQYSNSTGNLAMLSGLAGVDLSKYGWDDPIEYVESNAIQSLVDAMTPEKGGRAVRLRELAEFTGLPGRDAYVVGSTAQVCDELISWVDEVGIDGFNLVRTIEPRGLQSFVDLVVPELQNRGRYKTEYAQGTLRQKMGAASPRLPDTHHGASFRPLTAGRA